MVSFVPNCIATTLALLTLTVTACAPGGDMAAPTPTPMTEVKGVRGEGVTEMEADNFYFEPRFLRGQPGQRLTLRIRNESSTLHNFRIQEQQIDRDIPPGQTVEVQVTFPLSGSQPFECKYHIPQGMTGELLVGEATPSSATGAEPGREPGLGY